MSQNLMKNGGFEADWGDERSHRVLIFPEGAEPYEKDVGNIFTPPDWLAWFHHDPGTWDQPEVRDAWKHVDPRRVHSGQKGMLLFTFFRKHDAGFLQQVQVTPSTEVRLTAWAHAWSNCHGRPHTDDGRWSEGPGYDAGFCLEGEAPNSDWENFTFYVGIDPTGGTNPFADTVVWGKGAHVYNEYAQLPPAEATAQSDVVTVFLRSKTLWPFKHNDAYWDDASLVVVETAEVTITFEPAQPEVGDAVKVKVTSAHTYVNVGLEVTDPDGAKMATTGLPVGSTDGKHVWSWTFTAQKAGVHHVRFTASDGAETPAEANLVVGEPAPLRKGLLAFELLQPKAGDRVGVLVSSVCDFADADLTVIGPAGAAIPVSGPEASVVEGQYLWRWTFTAEKAGAYHARFTADGGGLTLAEGTLAVTAPPKPEWAPPRVPYARTYLLLPQDAGREWARAVLDSGKWEEGHWTIGSSADDAGCGPKDRTVIAVNPGKWPGDLRAFFDEYYPGAKYIPIEAATPAELTQKLKQL